MNFPNFNLLNIVIRSFTTVNDLILPLRIDISDIRECDVENIVNYKIIYDKNNPSDEYIVDDRKDPFEKIYLYEKNKKIIEFIVQHIDYNLKFIDGDMSLMEDLELSSLSELVDYFCNNLFSEDVDILFKEIIFYRNKAKIMFVNEAVGILELDKDFPRITTKNNFNIPKEYREHMVYGYGMLSLQPVAEYPMGIWFPENEGKAWFNWSWREQEFKRLYLTTKSKIDNFGQMVQSKMLDDKK